MKNIQFLFCFFCLGILTLVACKSQKQVNFIQLSEQHKVIFLDSVKASQAIVLDQREGFFDKISMVDMDIQMNKVHAKNATREEVLAEYKSYIQKDVLSFTESEKEMITRIMKRMHTQCSKLSPDLVLPEIRLIKTHAKHYGTSVYYTRDNIIVIPKYVLQTPDEAAFYSTMLHELFHIYSRFNPKKQDELYELIGFKRINNPEYLAFDEALKKKMLTNPDGVNIGFAIKLEQEGGAPVLAIPVLFSKTDAYDPSSTDFFNYVDFGLFEIKPPLSRMMKVISDKNGNSTISQELMADFFRQIKDNTNYIIHPDEVMADNFMFAILSVESPEYLDRFSTEGKALIAEIKEILKVK